MAEAPQTIDDPARAASAATIVGATLQHAVGLTSFALLPLSVAEAAGAGLGQKAAVFQASFLALAVVNALHSGPLSTGHLVPVGYTAVYVVPSMMAARSGGMALVMGMTIAAGALQIALSQVVGRIRGVIGPEVAGVVLILIGAANGLAGLRRLDLVALPVDTIVAIVATAVMLTVTLSRRLALYAMVIGAVTGGVAAWHWGLVDFTEVGRAPLIAIPRVQVSPPSFDWALLLPFAVAAVIVTIKQAAFVDQARRMDGHAPDSRLTVRSVIADGIGTAVSGSLGSIGMNASASSAGIKVATGVTDRRIGLAIAAFMLLLAALPPVALLVARMPPGIAAAVLIYSGVFVLSSGIREAGSSFDRDRSMIVGAALLAGLGVETVPVPAAGLPCWLSNLFASSIAVGAIVALALTLLVRLRDLSLTRLRDG